MEPVARRSRVLSVQAPACDGREGRGPRTIRGNGLWKIRQNDDPDLEARATGAAEALPVVTATKTLGLGLAGSPKALGEDGRLRDDLVDGGARGPGQQGC